jgi:PAS domain S-box-containing protein
MKGPISTRHRLLARFQLQFDPELEDAFLREYFHNSLTQVRFAIAFGGLLFLLFGLRDAVIIPEQKWTTWCIRAVIFLPLSVMMLLVTRSSRFERHMQPLLTLFIFCAGLAVVTLVARVPRDVSPLYSTGIFLVIMVAHTFIRLRFVYATVVTWAVIGVYEVTALWVRPDVPAVFLNNNFFFVAANLIGMAASFHIERQARRDFLQTRKVKDLDERRRLFETEQLAQAVKRATKSLLESEAKFRTLAETTAAGIFIHRGGKLLYANPAAEAISGYTSDEIASREFWQLAHPDHQHLVRDRGMARLQGSHLPPQYEIKFLRKGGEVGWVLMNAGLIQYQGAPALIGTLVDITDRKKAEEERTRLHEESVRQYQQRIEEQQRHQAEKEKILRDLHDGLGGITTNVKLLSEMAQSASSLDGVKGTLSTITDLATQGLSEIRLFMQSLDPVETTWRTLAAGLRQHGSQAVRSHGMEFSMTDEIERPEDHLPGTVYLNAFRIFREAVTNIVKHAGARSVQVDLRAVDGKARLSIKDDGRGLGEGSGRGVSNMKKRAGDIGGHVAITSANGTAVVLEFPIP